MDPWEKRAFGRLVLEYERAGLRDERVLRDAKRAAARGEYGRALEWLIRTGDGGQTATRE